MRRLIDKIKLLALVPFVYAQPDEGNIILNPPGQFSQRLSNLTMAGIIGGLIKLILIVAAIVFFFILVIGGIRWIVSGGDKAGTEAARGQITNALIGLVIVFSAYAIVTLIGTFFGIENIFTLPIPTIAP